MNRSGSGVFSYVVLLMMLALPLGLLAEEKAWGLLGDETWLLVGSR